MKHDDSKRVKELKEEVKKEGRELKADTPGPADIAMHEDPVIENGKEEKVVKNGTDHIAESMPPKTTENYVQKEKMASTDGKVK